MADEKDCTRIWINPEDHARLRAENERLRAQVSELRDAIENEMSIKEFEEFIARLYPPAALTPTTPEQE